MSAPEPSPATDGCTQDHQVGGAPQPTPSSTLGRFRYDTLTDTWWWSAEMFAIHGLRESEAQPTTELILSFKHPDDHAETSATLHRALATGKPFTQPHRVVTADGAVRQVISVGEGIVLGGRVVALHGYLVDVTQALERQVKLDVWQEASQVIEHRAVIERAKGALMVRYGIDADAAFELLKSWSSTRNEKLRDVARQVVDSL
ncbi:PAS and ANTAR domain-containing protein [Pedococcus bigeumensis]|uniref:PAS and ANTAR domain-containing protein n=1 Tax=Pedococcus bigeumensis TaxID=433644 RepID=UPI002FE9D293